MALTPGPLLLFVNPFSTEKVTLWEPRLTTQMVSVTTRKCAPSVAPIGDSRKSSVTPPTFLRPTLVAEEIFTNANTTNPDLSASSDAKILQITTLSPPILTNAAARMARVTTSTESVIGLSSRGLNGTR